MSKDGDYSDDFSLPVKDYISSERLKISSWLTADPTAILKSGNVVAFVHHGGANCYHEAVLYVLNLIKAIFSPPPLCPSNDKNAPNRSVRLIAKQGWGPAHYSPSMVGPL